jgi:hypothetical protein
MRFVGVREDEDEEVEVRFDGLDISGGVRWKVRGLTWFS